MSPVLVVGAHPDDPELAVGGTIAELTGRGISVVVALATVSEADQELRPLRRAAAQRAAKILGHELRWLLGGEYDQVEDIPEYELVRHLDALLAELRPTAVLTHWEHDSHGDHVRVARATTSASRRYPQMSVLHFGPNEVHTARFAEFTPNVYIPVEQHLARKAEALAQYAYPGQGFRQIDVQCAELIARARGLAVGMSAAEGLLLSRHAANPARSIFG